MVLPTSFFAFGLDSLDDLPPLTLGDSPESLLDVAAAYDPDTGEPE